MANQAAPLLMVDAAGARDRDDAISVTALPDGAGWSCEIHIAGVADVVAPGSDADVQAFLRGETRYLPSRTIPMLGPTTEAAATLTADADRASLQITATIRADGRLTDLGVRRGQLAAGRCVAVDHTEVPAILDDPTHPLHLTLSAADAATQALLAARRSSGALAFYDLTSGWAIDEDGAIVSISSDQRTRGYVIVQELMIATNEAVALWCTEQALPILFRNHRANPVAGSVDDLVHELVATAADPVLFDKLRGRVLSTLRVATYEPTVHAHHGLRLAAYTHITSPLRRLADLVNQRIILAHLDGASAPYTPTQLAAIGTDLNRRARERREATRNRYKTADQRVVAREAAGDLAALDSRRFSKVLKSQTLQPLSVDLTAEIDRRIRADLLTVVDVVALLEAPDPSWGETQRVVVDELSTVHPEMGPSVASAWRQAHPDQPEATMENLHQGPDHARAFAARTTHHGTRGPWMVRQSKKAAEQAAVWAAIRTHLAGHEVTADAEPDWPQPEPATTQPAAAVYDTAPTAEPKVAQHSSGPRPIALAAAKKNKALSNPVGWLMTLALNENLPAPDWMFDTDGPAHARQFTATVRFAGRTQSAQAGSKSTAKTRSAEVLIEELFTEANSQ
ncbi:ribonuclease R [Rhodococcus sp. Br-6]|nr:ribonuclease R [Rhodococcus sp. Br-6]